MTERQRTDRPELPDYWAADPYWRSALHILDGFGDDGRIWAHVTPAGIDYPAILRQGSWSGGERRLLQAAASVWNGRPVDVLDVLANIGDANWQRFLEAAQILRDGLR